MNHVSNLVGGTACGELYSELPEGDRIFAAFFPETQTMVTCVKCREKLGLEKHNEQSS